MFANKDSKLFKAIDKGNFKKVEELLLSGANVNARDKQRDDCTPLHVAVSSCDLSSMETLISCGANINAVSNHGYTPLMAACIKGLYRLIKLLVDNGADKNIQTIYGDRAIDFVKKIQPRDELIEKIIKMLEI